MAEKTTILNVFIKIKNCTNFIVLFYILKVTKTIMKKNVYFI